FLVEEPRGLTSSCRSKTMARQTITFLSQMSPYWSKEKSPGW
uniref:Uncharacterized protein n=1 Tax=Sus scrofa TaxID=9823 RepID=A0A4X1TAG3_PIG